MGSGFAKKKKQARMLQEQFSKMQDTLKNTEVIGNAPNELVQITINGDYDILKVKIKEECVDKDDVEGLEDLVKAALNDAMGKLKESSPMNMDMPNLGGMNIPGLSF
ncbi:MAG: YbaB/EbfC family nucleoid-associated protein [Parachlamydiales bacterium]|nr:YbaB/EbfC family nucleoid-associated protein [Parachlamydiales bacterium]